MYPTRTLSAALVSILAACSSDTGSRGGADAGGSAGFGPAGTAGITAAGGANPAGGASTGGSVGGAGATFPSGGSSASSGGASGAGGATGGAVGSGGAAGRGGTSPGGGASTGGASTGGASTGGASTGGASTGGGGSSSSGIQHVFVVAMENHDEVQIIGDTGDAPYINGTLVKNYASASQFADVLDLGVPSEPHYVLMEAGTNAFSDRTFTGDGDPTASNSTASTEHLVTQMKNAASPISFMSYQEGLDSSTGACPIHSSGYYAPKHDPFVFFQDVAGSPPSASNAYCVAHHKPMTSLAADLKSDAVAAYNFVTPNLCNDMHGASGCPSSNTIRAGDDWLKANLPAMIDYANGHRGVIFLVWDEGSATLTIPFLAVGPGVKKGYVSSVRYTHRSLVKSLERIFGLPVLAKVAGDADFTDLFESGRFP